jgi:hypothetical protein
MTLSYATSPDKLFGTIFMMYPSYMIKAAEYIVNSNLRTIRLAHKGADQNPLRFSLQELQNKACSLLGFNAR